MIRWKRRSPRCRSRSAMSSRIGSTAWMTWISCSTASTRSPIRCRTINCEKLPSPMSSYEKELNRCLVEVFHRAFHRRIACGAQFHGRHVARRPAAPRPRRRLGQCSRSGEPAARRPRPMRVGRNRLAMIRTGLPARRRCAVALAATSRNRRRATTRVARPAPRGRRRSAASAGRSRRPGREWSAARRSRRRSAAASRTSARLPTRLRAARPRGFRIAENERIPSCSRPCRKIATWSVRPAIRPTSIAGQARTSRPRSRRSWSRSSTSISRSGSSCGTWK